jgi:hypothetical protein
MGDVVRFPVERVDRYFDPAVYRETPAVILLLPVVRIDREVPEGPAPGLRRRRRRVPAAGGLLSPGTEERVRAAFERLRRGDVENPPDPGPAIGLGVWTISPWGPWGSDTGDETD